MTKAQLEKLLEYIDARIAHHTAADSSDGGLLESIRVSDLREELLALAQK